MEQQGRDVTPARTGVDPRSSSVDTTESEVWTPLELPSYLDGPSFEKIEAETAASLAADEGLSTAERSSSGGEPTGADDELQLPGWVTTARAVFAAAVASALALILGFMAWNNSQSASRWETVADQASMRASERASELALVEARLVTAEGEVLSLERRMEDLAAESAETADDAALFQQATLAGETAIADIVSCLEMQDAVYEVALDYAFQPSAGLEVELGRLGDDLLYWCGKARDSTTAFEAAVQLTRG